MAYNSLTSNVNSIWINKHLEMTACMTHKYFYKIKERESEKKNEEWIGKERVWHFYTRLINDSALSF